MSERLAPWRAKPTQEVRDLIECLPDVRMYVVARPGPTSFLIKEDGSEVKFKVVIGHCPCCTCMPSVKPGNPCTELCAHIIFVLIRVLRLPATNPLVWQRSLLDRELDEILRCSEVARLSNRRGRAPEPAPKPALANTPALAPGEVPAKPLDPEEPCPICYEDMTTLGDNTRLLLVHCRFGCGRSVHGRCMRVWMEHRANVERELTCPLCRTGWGEFTWTAPRLVEKKKETSKPVRDAEAHYGTRCGACKKGPIRGKRYLCLVCESYDLCSACFDHGAHGAHPFAVQEDPLADPTDVDRALGARRPASSSSAPGPSRPPHPSSAPASTSGEQEEAPEDVTRQGETDLVISPSSSAGNQQQPAVGRTAGAANRVTRKRPSAGPGARLPPLPTPAPSPLFGITGAKIGPGGAGTGEYVPPQPALLTATMMQRKLKLKLTSANALLKKPVEVAQGPRGLQLTGVGLDGASSGLSSAAAAHPTQIPNGMNRLTIGPLSKVNPPPRGFGSGADNHRAPSKRERAAPFGGGVTGAQAPVSGLGLEMTLAGVGLGGGGGSNTGLIAATTLYRDQQLQLQLQQLQTAFPVIRDARSAQPPAVLLQQVAQETSAAEDDELDWTGHYGQQRFGGGQVDDSLAWGEIINADTSSLEGSPRAQAPPPRIDLGLNDVVGIASTSGFLARTTSSNATNGRYGHLRASEASDL